MIDILFSLTIGPYAWWLAGILGIVAAYRHTTPNDWRHDTRSPAHRAADSHTPHNDQEGEVSASW